MGATATVSATIQQVLGPFFFFIDLLQPRNSAAGCCGLALSGLVSRRRRLVCYCCAAAASLLLPPRKSNTSRALLCALCIHLLHHVLHAALVAVCMRKRERAA